MLHSTQISTLVVFTISHQKSSEGLEAFENYLIGKGFFKEEDQSTRICLDFPPLNPEEFLNDINNLPGKPKFTQGDQISLIIPQVNSICQEPTGVMIRYHFEYQSAEKGFDSIEEFFIELE